MVSDSVAQRYALFNAGLDEVNPQIRGLQDKVGDDLSDELRVVLQTRLTYLETLAGNITEAKARQEQADYMAKLLDDQGFPTIPDTEIPGHLMAELNREGADDAAARGGFEAGAQASTISISLGTPGTKS